MRPANQLVADVLQALRAAVAPGVTTADLDALAEARVRDGGRRAGVQGVSRVPGDDLRVGERARWCTASRRSGALVEGDIVSIDMGAKLDGFFGDSAVTVPVGRDRAGGGASCCG